MEIILVDPRDYLRLAPLTLMRNTAELRFGIHSLYEKWEKLTGKAIHFLSPNYLQIKYAETPKGGLYINSAVVPAHDFYEQLIALKNNSVLFKNGEFIAAKGDFTNSFSSFYETVDQHEHTSFEGEIEILTQPWQLFKGLGKQIDFDLSLFEYKKLSLPNHSHSTIIGNQVYAQKGAIVTGAILNSEKGAIYLGKETEVMEGSVIRGPFALGDHSVVKLGAKIYGPTSVGPHAKVGGEISNSLIQGFSNKGHDGFLGNSILMEWCNLGADTNTSNLKNNYSEVKIYDFATQQMKATGQQFCGLIMGDHSKTGINTMLNTGTVVGVSANIFGGEFPPKYIPSFAWGGRDETSFKLEKAFEVAERMMGRRNVSFSEADRQILTHLSQNYR